MTPNENILITYEISGDDYDEDFQYRISEGLNSAKNIILVDSGKLHITLSVTKEVASFMSLKYKIVNIANVYPI